MVRVVNLRNPGRGSVTKVDRTTIFGNPVALCKECPECGAVHVRDPQMKAMVCYGRHLIRRLKSDMEFRAAVLELRSVKRLGCWCAPAACHADLLALFVNTTLENSYDVGIQALHRVVDRMADDSTRQGELF